jgi:putative hydrolase of the HAD superfamily
MVCSNIRNSPRPKDRTTWVILDLDDTLVDTSDVYYKAREKFLELMVSSGFPRAQTLETFERIETRNIRRLGILPTRYRQSMIETYCGLCANKDLEPSKKTEQILKRIGSLVIQTLPKPLPGAMSLLKWLYSNYFVVLISRGVDHYQRRKIETTGLARYLDRFFIVEEKTASTLKEIAKILGKDIGSAWVIGDSIKTDVNSAVKAGARSILYEYRHKKY